MKRYRVDAKITVGVSYTVTAESAEAAGEVDVRPTDEFGRVTGVLRLEGCEDVKWWPDDCYPEPYEVTEADDDHG